MSSPVPTLDELVGQLEARIARRDLPPVPAPDTFTPERTAERLAAHLGTLLPARNRRGLATQARMYLAFLAHEIRTPAQLAAAGGVGRVAGSYAHNRLMSCGLLTYSWLNRQRQFRLTRFGEDFLLAVARNENPPTAPQ